MGLTNLPANPLQPELELLRTREQHLRHLLNSARDAVVAMDSNGRVTEWNPSAQRLLGWSSEEAMGMPLADLIIPPEHRQAHEKGIQRYLRTRQSSMLNTVVEVEALRKDGTRMPAELSVWPIAEADDVGFGAILRDNTERRLVQDQLQRAATRYQSVVDQLGEGMLVIQDGVIVFANPQACSVFNLPMAQLIGMNALDLLHPDDQREVQERLSRRQSGENLAVHSEIRHLRPNGAVRWLGTHSSKGDWEGRPATMSFFADITERKEMLNALQRSEDRYRAVIEHVGEGMVVVKSTQFVFANTRAADIVEMTVADMLERGYMHRIHPEDHALVDNRRKRRLAGESVPNRYEIRLLMPDGRVKWIDIGVTIVPWDGESATLTFFSDVTARKLLEQQLTRTLQERETILNSSIVGIAFLTSDGRFQWTNPAMMKLFKVASVEGFHSMEAFYLSREQYLQVGGEVARAIVQGRSYQTEVQMRRADDQLIWVSLSGQAVGLGELSQGTVWTVLDITERKRAEEDIRAALEQQKELNDLRSRFVAMTSHEFRTPLATILSSAELLRFYGDRIVGAERLEIIQSIESSVHRMTSMLDRILVLGKAEAQMLEFNPQPLDVIAILGRLVQEAGDQAPQRSCHLKTDFPPDLGLAMLDDKLLRHIFGNLLSNAIKYSPNGGTVRLALRPDEAHMEFVVSDQGIGIPVAEQAHLFSSFHRASNVGDIKGTGLGLAIVKNAVEMHGGTIAVNSEPGAGTTFTIRLPFQRVSPG